MHDVLCIIPARGNSSRVPGKNKLIIGGKPCVVHAIDSALESRYNPHTVVVSDDDEILHLAKLHGAEAIVEPEEHAANDNMYFVLNYVLELCERRYGRYDAVAMLYGNVVNRPIGIVDKVLGKLFEADNVDSVVTVCQIPTHFHPYLHIQLDLDGRSYRWWPSTAKMRLLNTQDYPPVYCAGAAAHVCRRESFEAVWRDRVSTAKAVICDTPAIEIDTPEDVAWAEFLMSRQVLLADQRESYAGQG